MDILNLADLLLSPDEKNELHSSMELLEQPNYSAFYEKNQSIIQSILFLESLEEFLDFSKMPELVTDVVINALGQKRDAAEEELLKALNHYLDADTFIKL